MKILDIRTPIRALILGCTAFTGVDSVKWTDEEIPNIPDYDLVVVSEPHISEGFLKSVKHSYFERIRKDCVRLLHSGGKILVLVSTKLSVHRPNKYPARLSNKDWCPVSYDTPQEAAQSIVTMDDAYQGYLKCMSEWTFGVTIPAGCLTDELTDFYGSANETRYDFPLESYVENGYGHVLAGHFHIEVRRRSKQSSDDGTCSEYPEVPDFRTGRVVLLPLIGRMSSELALEKILQEEIFLTLDPAGPDWAQCIEMPGVPELMHRVKEVKSRIELQAKELQQIENQIADIQSLRKLLYGTGSELEEIVKRSLKRLGVTVSPSAYSEEGFVLEFEGKKFLIEVKGVARSIGLWHVRQLNDYVLKYQEETGSVCKGILFGNAWRNIPPEERGLADTPEFPDNVVERAERWGIALVSCKKFFDQYIKAIESSPLSNSLLVRITTSSGIVRF